jgi:tRNA-modifying protein YgfZ
MNKGYTSPMAFSIDQYHTLRQSSGFIDRTGRARIALHGQDRKTFLHALLTNDVAILAPGKGCYATLLSPQGRMVSDMRVFELGDVILLDVVRGVKDVLLTRFDQVLFSEDVQLGDVTDVFGCLSVQGPQSPGVVAVSVGGEATALAGWAPYQNARFDCAGEVVIVARVDEFGLPGYLLFTPMTAVPGLAAALASHGAMSVNDDTANVLRVEAGVPEFLVDMTDDTIPLEAGIEQRAISYTKGCYPGQEVIVRIRDRGHGRVVRKLVGMVIDGDTIPAAGDALQAGGRDVGRVTSAVFSPARSQLIALGYVHRDFIEPGSEVEVVHGDARLRAVVAVLPFS